MKRESCKASLRCAIYARVSTENGLEQEFNSLDNQREASEAYIRSQAHEGWKLIGARYDDGGFSGAAWFDWRGRTNGPRWGSRLQLRADRDIGTPLNTSRCFSKERASVTLGNGILPLETGRRSQPPLNAHNSMKYRAQTAFSPPKPLNLRLFPRIRKPPRSGLDGGRCRDRTCDPSRVKGVLYR